MKKALLLACVASFSQAATWHTTQLSQKNGKIKTVYYQVIDNQTIIEEDIVLTLASNTPSAVVVTAAGGRRWPNNTVAFTIDKAMPAQNVNDIYRAMIAWQNQTAIRFIELNNNTRAHYPDYIHFIPSGSRTCSSYVGRKGGEQRLKLGVRCKQGNTMHEIGHALGLWHEQSRADRNSYLRIAWENIEPQHAHNFEQHINNGIDIGRYNYGSIMHYGPYAFSKNGQQTLFPLQANVNIGQRIALSEGDIYAINQLYPRPSPAKALNQGKA